MIVFPGAIWGMCGVVALQVLMVWPDWRRLFTDGTVDRYTAIFETVMEGRIPSAYFELSLPGAFAVLATGVALGLAGLLIIFVTLLAMFPLFGFVMFATSSAEALRKAEQEKTATISQVDPRWLTWPPNFHAVAVRPSRHDSSWSAWRRASGTRR